MWCPMCLLNHEGEPHTQCPVCGASHAPPHCERKIEATVDIAGMTPPETRFCALEGCNNSVRYTRFGNEVTYDAHCPEHIAKRVLPDLATEDDIKETYEALNAVLERGAPLGRKDDQGKARYDLVPSGAEALVVSVLTYGAIRYGPDNWRHVPDARARYFAAARRHLARWRLGEDLDPESGLPHLAHATCCLLFLLELAV